MMRAVLSALALIVLLAPTSAAAKSGQRSAKAEKAPPAERRAERAPAAADTGGDGEASVPAGKTADGKTIKTKTYTFGAMDVEGKLKTPQLLYFLNRVKLELDMSAPDKRSFMKELVKSADDKSL
jgi:hypothetical protein